MEYELIREIFNQCSNNQMRDVFVSEVTTHDPEKIVKTYCTGKNCTVTKQVRDDGVIVYDLLTDGLRQRLSFTPD